jgi:F-type H+-transporting ATPase subunit epsilon
VPFQLSVVTPARPVVDCAVDSLVAPGAEGEFGVLPGHEPFLAPLAAGTLRFESGGRTQSLKITGGFAEVTATRVTILADAAQLSEEN